MADATLNDLNATLKEINKGIKDSSGESATSRAKNAEQAADALKLDASSLKELSIIDLIIDEDVECRLTSDDQFLSAATYASSALLHKDLDINPTCDYRSTPNPFRFSRQ